MKSPQTKAQATARPAPRSTVSAPGPAVGPSVAPPGPALAAAPSHATPTLDAAAEERTPSFPDIGGLVATIDIQGALQSTFGSDEAALMKLLQDVELDAWTIASEAEAFANASSVLARGADTPSHVDVDVQTARSQTRALMKHAAAFPSRAEGASAETREQADATRQACDEASLAVLQTLSVLEARRTWAQGVTEPKDIAPGAKTPAGHFRESEELNQIFAESGFNRYGAQATTKDDGTRKVADWCGMFVVSHLFRGGGIDEELRGGFLKTNNVEDYFQYRRKSNKKRLPAEIFAEQQWHELQAYHDQRGALRSWTPRDQIAGQLEAGTLDIRPGDVVLTNSRGGSRPAHITMVERFDADTGMLATIEGNAGGIQSPNAKSMGGEGAAGTDARAATTSAGHLRKDKGGPDGSVVNVRNLNKMGAHDERLTTKQERRAAKAETREQGRDVLGADGNAAEGSSRGAYKEKYGYTVFGIGRPSIVDFEEHAYSRRAIPEALRQVAPEDMKKRDLQRVGLRRDRNVRQ